jgi:tetratricopeptide (TPR) repeat protein
MGKLSTKLSTAVEHHRAGRLQAAEQIYRQILQTEPNHAEALHLLGVMARQVGKHELAVEYIKRAIGLKGNVAAFHVNLGNALKDQEKQAEAIACYRRALKLKPDFAEAHNNLGVVLKDHGKLDEAIACYRRALDLEPDYAEAQNNLGNALHDRGKLDEAVACHRRAVELNPHYVEAHNNLGNVLHDLGGADEAVACYRRALELKPDFAGAHKNLGDVLTSQGKLDEAVACYAQVVKLARGAVPCNQPAVPFRPRNAEMDNCLGAAFLQLATILRDRLPDEVLSAMRQLSSEPNLRDESRSALQYGLAQILDARGDYSAAAKHVAAASSARLAALTARRKDHDPVTYAAFVGSMLAIFTAEFFSRTSGFGLETEQPVFVVGLPRSGTTLVEQILASHSRVFGGGELCYCGDAFRSLPTTMNRDSTPFQCLPGLDRETARHLAWQYLDRLRALDGRALRIVDKMPENYLYLGFIRVLFPRARLIHCRRDLRDVALSCWMTNFASYPWACDPEHIASYFEHYSRVMDHWRNVLPARPLEVDYEQMVDDTERVARRIVEWCGLEWEAGCLRFFETQRPVRTASAAQVRRPIYKSSVGRWKHYEEPMGKLFSAVHELDPTRTMPG